MINLLFVGDIMPGGVLPYQKEWISYNIIDFLKQYDVRIGTLECALGDNIPFDRVKMEGKKNIIYSPEKELTRLKTMGFDIVSLANNHSYDLGETGLINTIQLLDQAGIKHCGAGINLEKASEPAIIDVNGKRIAFLAYCQHGSVYIGHLKKAEANKPGINPLDLDRCINDIKKAKANNDYVFVLPHWGIEYVYTPTPECWHWAHRMIDAGADGVFASHTHQINPLVRYHDRPIGFSMGNFLFPDYYMQPPRPIWYPDKNDYFKGLPHIQYYPKQIETPCIQEWKHLSRIGMAISCNIKDKEILAYPHYTYLNSNNILDIYAKYKHINARMKWMGYLMTSNIYPIFYRIYQSNYNLPRRGYHFLKRYI